MLIIFIKRKQDGVMKNNRNGQYDHGRLPGEVTQTETGMSAEPVMQATGR